MVKINELYETKISSSSSEVLLNDIVTITIRLIDFNGNPVNRNNVTITSTNGMFVQTNNTSYTGNTSNGVLIVEYKATENGLVRFKCNNAVFNLYVTGKKALVISTNHGGNRDLIIDVEKRVIFFPYKYEGSFSLSSAYTGAYKVESSIIPVEYRPIASVRVPVYNSNVVGIINNNGDVHFRSVQNTGTISNAFITFQWTF